MSGVAFGEEFDAALEDMNERDRVDALFTQQDDERGPYYTTPLDTYVERLQAEFQAYYDEVVADAPEEVREELIEGLVDYMVVVAYNLQRELSMGDVISTQGYATIVDLDAPDEDGTYGVIAISDGERFEGVYGGPVLAPLPDTMFCMVGSAEAQTVPFSIGLRLVEPRYFTEDGGLEVGEIFDPSHTVVVPINVAGTRFVKHHYQSE